MDVDILRRHPADEHLPFVVLDATELLPIPESVVVARRFARTSLARFEVGPDPMDDLVLAVSEAFTNAVEAHARRGVDGTILVRCTADAEVVGVEVEDRAGGGIDFAGWQPRATLRDRDDLGPDRGWGIQLIRELVDLATFESTADGTLVRLAVRR
jgi:anti-sigma regulatory factor (Ser/Thr protein kinase)